MGQGHSGWPKHSCRLRSIPSLKSLVESFLKLCDTSAFVGSPIGERLSWYFEGYEGINEDEGKVLGEPLDEIESHNNVFIVLKEQPCDSNNETKGHSQENSEFPEERREDLVPSGDDAAAVIGKECSPKVEKDNAAISTEEGTADLGTYEQSKVILVEVLKKIYLPKKVCLLF